MTTNHAVGKLRILSVRKSAKKTTEESIEQDQVGFTLGSSFFFHNASSSFNKITSYKTTTMDHSALNAQMETGEPLSTPNTGLQSSPFHVALASGPSAEAEAADVAFSDRFLHSEEQLAEFDSSTDDDTLNCETGEDDYGGHNNHNHSARKDDMDRERRLQSFHALRGDSLSPAPPTSVTQQSVVKDTKDGGPQQLIVRRRRLFWAEPQLHRSVSLDDLMEYQREFDSHGWWGGTEKEVSSSGRSNSSRNVTATANAAPLESRMQQQTQTDRETTTLPFPTEKPTYAIPRRSQSAAPNKLLGRTSIANSDLDEFKRIFCQARGGQKMLMASLSDSEHSENEDTGIKDTKNKDNNEGNPEEALNNGIDDNDKALGIGMGNTSFGVDQETRPAAVDYQWGTRSLRRAILGSDLIRFERSVRTALLESSRENSSENLDTSTMINTNANAHATNSADAGSTSVAPLPTTSASRNKTRTDVPPTPPRSSSVTARESRDSRDGEEPGDSIILGADWGTRSLRKSLRELDLNDDAYHHYPVVTDDTALPFSNDATNTTPVATNTNFAHNQMQTIHDDQEALDTTLISPWQDDKEHPTSASGLKMPRRVTSGGCNEHSYTVQQVDVDESSFLSTTPNSTPTSTPPPRQYQDRSRSVNDVEAGASSFVEAVVATGEQPQFEWQVRSPFRRSISSSDIEKYQRHFDGGVLDEGFGELSDSDSDDDEATQTELLEIHTQPSQESATSAKSAPPAITTPAHPLASLRKADTCASTSNDAMPKQPKRGKKKGRGHRRSNSDEPELLMESTDISDVAPRKPTRTTSRPKSPPPVYDGKPSVRFATNQNFVVEIPKVTEEMKPNLFYTKRDVKRFRMNEHRRQEAQIRAYVEYLNEKENALDSTPSIYDSR